jgi:hypothetical protein
MEKWIAYLDASQGVTHVATSDLYWYIEKLQEVKLLVEGITQRDRFDLKSPLIELSYTILVRLERDEGHQREKVPVSVRNL